MLTSNKKPVTCAGCGTEFKVSVLESISAQANPEQKNQILANEFFSATCPSCGEATSHVYDCLYQDIRLRSMVHMLQVDADADGEAIVEKIDELNRAIKSSEKNFLVKDEEYQRRVVYNPLDFVEKILIKEAELDDRLIEMLKVYLLASLNAGEGAEEIEKLYFETRYGQPEFTVKFASGELAAIDYDQAYYDNAKALFGEPVNSVTTSEFVVIDENWAKEFIAVLNSPEEQQS